MVFVDHDHRVGLAILKPTDSLDDPLNIAEVTGGLVDDLLTRQEPMILDRDGVRSLVDLVGAVERALAAAETASRGDGPVNAGVDIRIVEIETEMTPARPWI